MIWRMWRLVLVALLAAGAFAVAVERFSGAAEKACAQKVAEDPSYSVRFAEPPSMEMSRYRLIVTRDGRPVTGAQVCFGAYMRGMSAMAVLDEGIERSPGAYELSLTFEMGGKWQGRALIAEPGKALVAVAVPLQVQATDR